ncbi:hypothetical protein KY285_014699 [Solanum tuberosum]|nr:hypothetical protein KY284_014667 [Solanum tuberosum]KAH0718668.1 hypothetical protein KY285_014699 [Solanum tuberosum]
MAAQTSHSSTHYEDGESSTVTIAAVMRHDPNLKQKGIMHSRYDSRYEVGESSGSNVNETYRNNSKIKLRRNSHLQCDFCHLKGHTREKCYKLIGYPPDFKFTRNMDKDQNSFR